MDRCIEFNGHLKVKILIKTNPLTFCKLPVDVHPAIAGGYIPCPPADAGWSRHLSALSLDDLAIKSVLTLISKLMRSTHTEAQIALRTGDRDTRSLALYASLEVEEGCKQQSEIFSVVTKE